MKLNLGCGDKILPGYINVDILPERNGKKVDLVSDIRYLDTIENNTVDEILNIHIIEHFYYWEIPSLLQEWIRVMKPGGIMVTETPDLLNACKLIVEDPLAAAGPDASMSSWPLYGNPNEKDPLMCHKWLFTPESLTKLLQQCGFVNIRKEPARYKRREPRDFRLVAKKPEEI